jgi:hypothetical protein
MSTKTTFKRVALVAVASLGFGVLTSVAPATAATDTTAISAGTSAPARVSLKGGKTTLTLTSAAVVGTETITAQIVTAPSTSAAAILEFGAASASTTGYVAVTNVSNSATSQLASTGIAYATYTSLAGTKEVLTLSLTPDKEGTYQILVTVDGSTTTGYSAGKISTNFTVTTTGAPTALTLASVGGKVTTATTRQAAQTVPALAGQLFKLTMKDANGNATVLGLNESIALSDNSDATTALHNAAGDATAISSFGQLGDSSGAYYVRVVGGTVVAGSGTLTASGAGLLSSSVTVNATYTKVAVTDAPAAATFGCTTTTLCVAGSDYNVSGAAGLTFTALAGSTTAAVIHSVIVTDNAGLIYSDVITVAAATTAATTTTYTSPAVTSSALTSSVKLLVTAGPDVTKTFNYVVPAAGAIAVQGVATVLSATAGKNSFTVLVSDQYGTKIANAPVTVAVSGRNTVSTTALGVTDANGLISYSLTDAGTTGTKDTFTFTGGGTTATAIVNYGTVTVSTVTVTGGATADTVAGTTVTAISAADNGPEASRVAIKAVVKDASGNLLAGVPVVFTVDKGLVYKTAAIDYATVYTGTDGSATTHVFNWMPGTQTVTATAGGVAKTGIINWAATDATSARVLSATATGDIVSVKVVDRFGNAVKGVSVDLSRTGTGLFGSGSSTQTVVTDKNGTSDVRFSGTGTVVAELGTAYVQAADAAGFIAETAVTAAVAGTTKGTGATLAPAGVAKVSIAIEESANSTLAAATAASDAAAEATDAANAATDAANAAAEAADAATAAAQDAADAVAALATQVTEMMDAMKKQITALTNLVIKIQKKVKA